MKSSRSISRLLTGMLMIGGLLLLPCQNANSTGGEESVTGDSATEGTTKTLHNSGDGNSAEYVPGELLIKFIDNTKSADIGDVQSALAAKPIKYFARIGLRHWQLGSRLSVKQALALLANAPFKDRIEYAEPNYIITQDTVPNDLLRAELYGMHNIGQSGGLADADIDALEAWQVQTGSADVVVAIIDSGIDYNHQDLSANIWTNLGETVGNGQDDDSNGYVDDVHGWDFYNSDNDPFDDAGHGTHTAGTVGAVGNNGIGVAGVAWNVKLMPVKIINILGYSDVALAVEGILYATSFKEGGQNVVRITNNSYSFPRKSKSFENAIKGSGSLFACSAGNYGNTSARYPAYYSTKLSEVIAVAATDDADQLASFSSYGANWVALGAPGVNILSTLPGDEYAKKNGTSMSAPHVAGALALVLAQYHDFSNAQMKAAILDNVDPIPALAGKTITGGRLNVRAALGADELPSDTLAPADVMDLTSGAVTDDTVSLSWNATADDGTDQGSGPAYYYDLRYLADTPISEANWGSAGQATAEPLPQAVGTLETFVAGDLNGSTTYYFAVKVVDELGNSSAISNVTAATTEGTPPPPWNVELVDSAGNAGYYKSLVYNATGQPCLAYSADSIAKYACYNGASWDIETIDVENGGGGISLAFNPNTQQPAVSYVSGGKLWFAQKQGSSWSTERLEPRRVSYTNTGLAFDGSGNPAISYRLTGRAGGLKFAHYNGSSWDFEIVDSGAAAVYNSLVYDPDGNPAIAYTDDLSGSGYMNSVKYARHNGSSWDIQLVESGYVRAGYSVSLAFDPVTWYPAIFHIYDPTWTGRLATYNGSSWSFEDVGEARYGHFTFDAFGVPYVAAMKGGGMYMYKKAGSTWDSEVVEQHTGQYFTWQPSIAIAPNGLPAIGYTEHYAEDLKFAKHLP